MRILIASAWYPPVLSGSSLHAESLVKSLQKRGHEVRVVTTQWKGIGHKFESDRQEIVYHLPARLLPRNKLMLGLSIVPISFSLANRKRIIEIVQEFKPDVIHHINHIFDLLFLTAYAAKKKGIPLVGNVTTPIQSRSTVIYAIMSIIDLMLLYNFGIKHWKKIICFDSEQARYVLERYGNRVNDRVVTDIYPGIHERIQTVYQPEKPSRPQIIMAGHVHSFRDPTNVIRAMPIVLKRFPNTKLIIVGRVQFDRPVKEAKKLNLDKSVCFMGEVPPEKIAELVSTAHIFAVLHQMKYAGFSFTAMEAMHFGKPVVINVPNDLYGPGIIKDGENIVLVDRDDVEQIAKKIINLLDDAALRARIGRNAKKFVDKYLSWDFCAEKTEKLYKELTQK
jgi:glycosyltransferase involved in cell wall biosynthesis